MVLHKPWYCGQSEKCTVFRVSLASDGDWDRRLIRLQFFGIREARRLEGGFLVNRLTISPMTARLTQIAAARF